MALSGVMGNTFKNGWRLQLEWSATQNLVNNTSTITSNLYLIGQYSWSSIYTSSVNSCNITIDGTNNGDTFSPSLSGNQKKLISSATKTVTHNSTGVKNFSIGAWADMKVTLSGQYIGRVTIPNQTFTLNPIPRKSTIITIPNLNIGNSLDIKINVASSDFTHTMKYYVNDTLIKDFNIVGNTVTMTTTTAQDNVAYNLSPTSTKVNTKLVLNTYSGSTLMGTDIVTGTGTITNAEPSFTNFEYKDTIYSSRTGNNQVLIAGKSSLTVDIPAYMGATGNKGASIVSYQISMGIKSVIIPYSSSAISQSLGTIDTSGVVPLKVTAVDSRGLKKTLVKNVTVLEYSEPKAISKAERYGGFEATTEIQLEGLYSPLTVGGIAKNYLYSLQYRLFEKGGTIPSFTSISTSTITYSGNNWKASMFTKYLDINKTYILETRVEDMITGGQFFETTVYSGIPPWLFEGDGNIRFRGGLIQVGNEKTLANDGKTIERFTGATGTDAGLRALKMGDNSVSAGVNTNFPSTTGAWLYYQGADTQGNTNGDFILWKNRLNDKPELYVGVVKEGQATDFGKIVTIVDEGTYSRSGTTGSYIKYSDGRLEIEFERTFPSTNFVSSASNQITWNWITGDIWFPIEASFITTPIIMTNASAGEVFGFANRETYTTRFNLRLFASTGLTMGITLRGFAKGKWK